MTTKELRDIASYLKHRSEMARSSQYTPDQTAAFVLESFANAIDRTVWDREETERQAEWDKLEADRKQSAEL